MNSPDSVATARLVLTDRLFPQGVPRLWCPLITPYNTDGKIDGPRLAAHLRHLAPYVKGFLIPGSTGDGWEMDAEEVRSLLEIALDQAVLLKFHLLIGVLKTDAPDARRTILDTAAWLQSRTGADRDEDAFARTRVCGFTVCPPRGKDLTQEEIGSALDSILETRLPVSLYQLPQVTENTMSPGLVAGLAARHFNFILFKDTSGADVVAFSKESFHHVFLVRGAEGDYSRWLKEAGGPYEGFLLSTANCFGRELFQIVVDVGARRRQAADQMSGRLAGAVREAFEAVKSVPQGNPFANANKTMDHFFAHGPGAVKVPPPLLHAGTRLPVEVIRATGEILSRYGFMPDRGYLD